jgi:hypothetical protein
VGASVLPYALIGDKVPYIGADFIDPFNRLPNVLTVMTHVPPSNDASPERRVIDGSGRVLPVQARIALEVAAAELAKHGAMSADHASMEVVGDRVCITAQPGGSVSMRLPAPVAAPSLVAELTFDSKEELSFSLAATNQAKWWYSPVRTTLRPAQGHALTWVDPGAADGLALAALSPGHFCLERVVLATPHFPPDAQGRCASVDLYGLPGQPVACGGGWQSATR